MRRITLTNLPEIVAPSFKTDTFSIVRYGAISDGITLNTQSIDKAIAECSRSGGGVVLVPAGFWLTGPIVLRSGVNLHIDRAAILQFTDDFSQYPLVKAIEGRPAVRCQSPISGEGLENVAITGTESSTVTVTPGDRFRDSFTAAEWSRKLAVSGSTLSDDGKTWFPSEKNALKGSQTKDAGVWEEGKTIDDYKEIKDFLRPNLVVLTRCKKVLLEGPSFQNSPAWCLHPLMCENLTLRDVRVRNLWNARNGDGVDIESCKNVLVENSTFDAGDDGICIKSGRDADEKGPCRRRT